MEPLPTTRGREGPSPRAALAAGAAAATVALGLLWALSRLDRALVFPPLALAELVIRATPGDVATFFIEELGKWAIRSLAIAATISFATIGALIAWGARRSRSGRWGRGAAALAFAGILLGAAFGANVDPAPLDALVVAAIGGVSYFAVLAWLVAGVSGLLAGDADIPRRSALAAAGSAGLGFALGGTLLGRLLDSPDVAGGAPIGADLVKARRPRRPAFPKVAGLSKEVTPVAEHYVVDINLTKPVIDPASWRLTVGGLVDDPFEVGLEEMQSRFGLVEEYSVLTCVSNEVGGPLIGNSKWTGVPLREVLIAAGLQDATKDLLLTGADGYTVTIRPDVALGRDALLAVAQDGEPLTTDHGAPCRLRVPRLYGMMNCKWLERIEAIGSDASGYWAQRGWSDVAIVRTQSRIDTVQPAPAAGATSLVAGVAWAGDRGVSRVEVSTDGGQSWGRALLRRPLSPVAWSQWAYEWTPRASGTARVVVRATDGTGKRQTADRAPPHPAGATGYHEIEADVA